MKNNFLIFVVYPDPKGSDENQLTTFIRFHAASAKQWGTG